MIIGAALLLALLSLSYILLQNSEVQTLIIQKITRHLSAKTNADIRIGKVEITFFKRVVLTDVLVADQNHDTIFYSEWVSAKIDTLKLRKRKISIEELAFEDNKISVTRDSATHFNFSFLLDSLQAKPADTTKTSWQVNCHKFRFQNSEIIYHDLESKAFRHIPLHQLNLKVSDFVNKKDSLLFSIDELSLHNNRSFYLEQSNAKFKWTPRKLELGSANFKTGRSEINNLDIVIEMAEGENEFTKNSNFDFQLSNSVFDFKEIADLVPSLEGITEVINLSGRIYGNIDDVKGKNVMLTTGKNTSAELDFYINGIENFQEMYLFLDLKKLETSFRDISSFTYPKSSGIKPLIFPDSFYKAGIFKYNGNFSGFLSDFVTYGTLKSFMGTIRTDLSVIPERNKTIHYNGKISTTEFKLGSFLKSDKLGNITFNGEIDGNYQFSDKLANGLFKGEISKIVANNYEYRNIKLDGIYMDKMFDGMVAMNDTNLQFTFLGRLDMSTEIPAFDFNMKMEKLRPGNLNLGNNYPNAELSFNMKAKFTGDKLDDLKGAILVEDGYYKNKNGDFSLKGLQLISVPNATSDELQFTSDYFDIEINGNYNFQSIVYAFQNNISHFLPSFNFKVPANFQPNVFDFKINVKKLDDLTKVFLPELQLATPFFLYGKMNSVVPEFELEGSIPGLKYQDFTVRNIFIGNKTIDTHYSSKFKFGEIIHKNGFSMFDLTIGSEIANDIFLNTIEWNNEKDRIKPNTIKTKSYFTRNTWSAVPSVVVDFFPSDIYLTDEPWHYDHFTTTIDSSLIHIYNFNLYNNNQSIGINGQISKDSIDVVDISFNNINLETATKNMLAGKKTKGVLNCSVKVSDLYRQPVIIADLKIDKLQFEDQFIGDVNLTSWWDQENLRINSDLSIINNNRKSLSATGWLQPYSKEINYMVNADSLQVKLLETVIVSQFSDFTGLASGSVKFGGSFDKITMDGTVKVIDGSLVIDYTKTKYFVNDFVYFKTDTIHFDNTSFRDVKNNTGKFNGTLVHDNFRNMRYDFTAISPKILAYNTTVSDNEIFFGDIYANAKIKIFGRGPSVFIQGSATTLPGTAVNIAMEYESDVEQYDFLEFVSRNETEETNIFTDNNSSGEFNINLTIEATPEAKVQLIYNSQIGDVIKAQGEGILLFEMNKDYDISLSGNYTVTKGDYLFTLQNLVNKRFTIAPGGSIIWSGDPYNADIDISAIYKLKASLGDLMADFSSSKTLYQRIPVECVINLTDELINPSIAFDIVFPEENQGARNTLQQFFNTDEEKNKQILSLIILGKFFTPEYMRGQLVTQNANMIGTTASELFSNQLSNWLSQISNNVDFGFKYRPGNNITKDEMELALSTQILNDRVLIDGNIGNNVNPLSSNNSQIVGDFDIRVKLVPSGKIQFKAYNHSNNNLIYETAPYTQGIGLTFKEEYNSLDELLNKLGSIFKKKSPSN